MRILRGPIAGAWVERHADDIIVCTVCFESVEHPAEQGVVEAVGQVHDNLGAAVDRFYRAVA
ncbi:hypothetical protein D3C79_1072940 [compost metagenome]